MARTKGSKNKKSPVALETLDLAIEERIRLIADLIVDRIEARRQSESAVAQELVDA